MPETTAVDPVFGKLVYDGTHHGGWATSFVDKRFEGWGAALDPFYARFSSEESAPKFTSESFAKDLITVAGAALDPAAAEKALAAAREFDAYDGQLDSEQLRKAGRHKLVVKNLGDQLPTAAQQQAWKAFRDAGDALAGQVIQKLFAVCRQHRPEVLRWWAAIYRDSAEAFVPEITSPDGMRSILRPVEFRIHAEEGGEDATVGLLLQTLWSDRSIDVRIRQGQVVSVGPEPSGLQFAFSPRRLDAPPFGPMRWRKMDGWSGTSHSDHLRGYHAASQDRYRFAQSPELYEGLIRQIPPWDVITGDFELHVSDGSGDGPSPEQADAYRQFIADPQHTAQLVLDAILQWYKDIRPNYIECMDDPEEIAAYFPEIDAPEGLLEIIQLQCVNVWSKPDDSTKGVAIGLTFAWEDEHGLGVRWRNGQIEAVGDAGEAEDQ